jgi:DNA adenine methylase
MKYVGGKYRMIKNILNLLDYGKRTFIDIFGGSGKVILNLPENKYLVKIYNDINNDMVNLFYQIKNNPEKFQKAIEVPYAKNVHSEYVDKFLNSKLNTFERAVSFYVVNNQGFGGYVYQKIPSWGLGIYGNIARFYKNKCDDIKDIYEKLRDIELHCIDAFKFLDLITYKSEEYCMIYVDPPYVGTERYYAGNFDKESHIKLAEKLNKMKSSVMVSYYYFAGIEKLYPKDRWQYFEYKNFVSPNNGNEGKREKATELLLLNYLV